MRVAPEMTGSVSDLCDSQGHLYTSRPSRPDSSVEPTVVATRRSVLAKSKKAGKKSARPAKSSKPAKPPVKSAKAKPAPKAAPRPPVKGKTTAKTAAKLP